MKYFDYAATTPLDQDAADIFVKASTAYFGNSQSLHDTGSTAANLLESCRNEFSKLLDVDPKGIFFTSGGSEANFLGIMALLSAKKKHGKHIITGAAEHSSVYNLMKKLELEGWEITFLPLNHSGYIEIGKITEAARDETVLISVHHVNPEIGTIQPIQDLAEFCKKENILFHTDCVQSFGKLPLGEIAREVDALSISGHKFYGPKGTGAAYLNPRLAWKPFMPGTAHENGFRPGTVNVPGIAAMTAAAQKVYSNLESETKRIRGIRSAFIDSHAGAGEQIKIFGGNETAQLPGIIGMGITGLEGQYVMLECNRKGFAISTGTACHIGMQAPAKTMTAMGLSGKEAKEFFRISFGKGTKQEDAVELGKMLAELPVHTSSF
jgi:cysteine desulfurase